MKEITDCFKPRYFLARFKFTIQLLVSVLLLSSSAYAQTNDPISILWSGGVGCQVYEAGEPPRDEKEPLFLEDIGDSTCFRVCENSTITYFLDNLPAGSTVDWNVIGGAIQASSTTECTVNWGAVGFGSLNFLITTGSTVLTKTICFEKIISPKAQFVVLPYAMSQQDVIPACQDQLIYFTNQSHDNGGTAIVYYHWDFGDGNYSVSEHPTHSYSNSGSYEIKLTVFNSCHCSSTYTMRAEIGPKGFDISCPSIVCEGQRAIYSLPFNGREACDGAYNWSVVGGTIENINQQNGDLTVIWDDVDESGFGYVTFDPRHCRLDCYFPTTIRVPVIQSKGTIIGPEAICVKTFARYELPQWPTTDFQWEVVDNFENSLADVILTDQRNEVVIFPRVVGSITLKATYVNTLTGCSGVATLKIFVEPSVQILGDSVFCVGHAPIFTTHSGESTEWTLYDNNENVITTLNDSNQFQYTFNTPGNYILSTAGSALCEGEQKTITIEPRPETVALSEIVGNIVICPTQPYGYSISNPDPNSTYHWTIQNGNFIGSDTGSSVNVSFDATGPYSLTVIRQSINPIVCSSLPGTVPITLQQVLVNVVSENNVNTVCANTYQDFFGYQSGTTTLYTEGETYTWSLSDTSLGSVTQGQGTNAATVLWYNVSTPTVVDVILTIQKCTLPAQVFSYSVTIVPIPIIEIIADSSVCSGTDVLFTLSSVNGVVLDPMSIVTWTNGNVTQTGGLSHYFTILNNGNQNIGRTITAYIESPNGCSVSTNTAIFNLTVLPGPPASLSIVSGGNEYCEASEINTVLEIGTSIAGLNVTWYRNGVILSPQPNPITSLTVTPAMGFGSYRFRVVDSSGCVRFSNVVTIFQDCNDIGECTLNPMPELTNTSYNDCGIIYLSGTTTVPSSYESFKIVGPNFNSNNFTGTQFTAAAGEHHIFYQAAYNCVNPPFSLATLQAYEKITVPYVPKFSYEATCNSNTDFTVTFYDETNFFAPVTARQVNYFIRDFGTPASSNVAISGDQIAALPGGTYIVTQVVSGELDLVLQDECSIELEITLTTMSSGMFIENELIFCHDTSVRFVVTDALETDTFFWTFDENASSTLRFPERVFTLSGAHTVYVTVTNNLGCSQTLLLPIDIPEKCFTGDVVVTPNPPTVCAGQGVTLTYVPGVNESTNCFVDSYVWMNGVDPVTPAVNNASITVTTPGLYWVKLISGDLCEYATPSRITPVFKPLPSLNLTADVSTCFGEEYKVKATTNASSISWSLNTVAQQQFTDEMEPIFTSLPVGTHQLTATATLNGCSVSSTLSVVVIPSPTDLVILTPNWVSCDPYTYTLTAQTTATNAFFTWSDGQTGSTITVTAGGPYKVTATVGECSVSAQTDVPKNPEIYSWIFPSGCYDACKENIGTLIGPRVFLPYWAWLKDTLIDASNVNSFPTPYDLSGSGEYAFSLNTGDCALTTEPLIFTELDCEKCKIERIMPISITKNNDIFCSFTVELAISSGDDFNAVLSSLSDNMIINPSAFPISTGTFTYMITIIPTGNFTGGTIGFMIEGLNKDGKPCSYQFNLELPACEEENQASRAIAEETMKSMQQPEIKMYPNPTQGEVSFTYSGLASDATLQVYDLTGRLMNELVLPVEQKEVTLLTATYPTGVYVVVLRQGGVLVGQYKLVKH